MRRNVEARTLIVIGAVCIIVAAAHWPAIGARALSFDDNQYLIDNALVQNPSWASAKQFLVEILEPSTVGGYYQPLAMISLMLDYAAGGRENNLRPFHITSLALHTANTVLIIVLLYMLFGNIWAAAAAGLLFGVHPMTVEPIPWVGERKTLLAVFFALWSLTFYVRYSHSGRWQSYAGCFAMYLLALMSKPTSVPLPAVMLLMDYWPLKRLSVKSFLEKLPLFALGAVFAVITYISQHRTGGTISPMKYGPWHIPLVLCHNIIFYLYKMILPINLSSHYAFPKPVGLSHPMVLAGVIGTCILIPLLLVSLRWTRAALTGWLIFFVAIFPTMQIIGFSNVIASDKFAYLPAIGLLMPVTLFLIWVGRNKKVAIAAVALVLVLTGAEAFATRCYLSYWKNTITLNKYMIQLAPDAPPLYSNLGFGYIKADLPAEGLKAFQHAIDISPNNDSSAFYNLGVAYSLLNRNDEAVQSYLKAAEKSKHTTKGGTGRVKIYSNLGVAYFKLGRYAEAVQAFNQAIEIKPGDTFSLYNLGVAYSKQGQWSEAAELFKRTVELKPDDASAYFNLGVAYEQLGRLAEAIDAYEHAVKANPKHTGARFNLAMAYLKKNEKGAAMEQYEILRQLNPELAQELRDHIK